MEFHALAQREREGRGIGTGFDLRGEDGLGIVIAVDRHQWLEHVVDDFELDEARCDMGIERSRPREIGVDEAAATVAAVLGGVDGAHQPRVPVRVERRPWKLGLVVGLRRVRSNLLLREPPNRGTELLVLLGERELVAHYLTW